MAKNPDWTEKEIKVLRENYQYETKDSLLNLLKGRNWSGIQCVANREGLHRMNYLTDKEIKFIIKNRMKMRTGEIGRILGRSKDVIQNKSIELGIFKFQEWTKKEIKILKENFGKHTIKYIKKNLLPDRGISAINHVARGMGLQKEKKRFTISNEEIVTLFKKKCEEIGRTITSKELSQMGFPSANVISNRFGSFNKFCEICELPINTGFVTPYKGISKLGEPCKSNAEKLISDFLFDNNINYRKEILYSDIIKDYDKQKIISDWVLDNGVIIEYFGMSRHKKYKKKMKLKISLCEKHEVKLIELYEKDLSKLEEKIIPFIK